METSELVRLVLGEEKGFLADGLVGWNVEGEWARGDMAGDRAASVV